MKFFCSHHLNFIVHTRHTSIHTNSNWHPILVLHTTCYVIHTRHTPFHTNNNWSHHMLYCSHATHLHSQHQIHFTPNINASHHMLGHSHTIHTLSHQQQLVTPHAILFTHDTPSFTPNTLHTQYQCFTPHAMSLTPNTYPFTPRRGTKHVVITPSSCVHTMLVWLNLLIEEHLFLWCEQSMLWYKTCSRIQILLYTPCTGTVDVASTWHQGLSVWFIIARSFIPKWGKI